MAIVQEAPKPVMYASRQAGIDQKKLMAKLLLQMPQTDPNQMVGNQVVATHPLSAIADALKTGMGTYMQMKGMNEDGQLGDEKQKALQGLVASGKTGIADLAASGLISPDKLAEALAKQSATQAEYQFLPGEGGTWLKGNKGTGDIQPSDFKNPLYDPAQQRKLKGISEALKGGTATDATGHEYYAPAMQRNPFYQQFVEPSYDQPTPMMPAPGQPKAQGMLPQVPQTQAPGVYKLDENSPEAQAVMQQLQQQGIDPNTQEYQATVQPDLAPPPQSPSMPPQAPVLGQSPAEEAAAKANATMPIEVQQAAQIAEQKAQIENEAKLQAGQQDYQMKAQQDLPAIQSNAEYTKQLIDEIANHQGLESVVGAPNPLMGSFGSLGALPGTDAAGFNAKLDQLKGKQFLEAFQSLKGGGQITELEGKKATDAIAAMSTSQKEVDFKKELAKLKEVIDKGYARANMKATGQPAPMDKGSEIEALRRKHGL